MSVFAAVMTGKGTGAIATIQLFGDSAKVVLEKIFKPAVEFIVGQIYVGKITEDNQTIDQVTIGCEKPDTFTINCHGNPLIVEQIMQLLAKNSVELLTAAQMLCKMLANGNTIALEAKLNLPKAKTIEGTKIILNQIDSGLSAVAKKWQKADLKKVANEAQKIIEASKIARLIIFGCKIALAGPPNTGKSTLLNRLAGREKAIVTDIKGTTRDWVSANCRLGPIAVELFDTAGLDEKFVDTIDKASQQAAVDIINQADLILLVLDNSVPIEQLNKSLTNMLADKIVLTIINKSDLPCRLKADNLPNAVNISAKLGKGIDNLCTKIQQLAGIDNFDFRQPVCFTDRQQKLLTQLANADSKDDAGTIITELLSGPLSV
jgi:tRNA modification GTPase